MRPLPYAATGIQTDRSGPDGRQLPQAGWQRGRFLMSGRDQQFPQTASQQRIGSLSWPLRYPRLGALGLPARGLPRSFTAKPFIHRSASEMSRATGTEHPILLFRTLTTS